MTSYAKKERARYWPISRKLMAHYNDRSHANETSIGLWWYQNGLAHRDGDKPAYISPKGTLYWYQNAKTHRDGDLPAVIRWNGTLEWWQNNQLHRICGPAVIYNSVLEWWINGQEITQDVRTWLNRKPWRGTPEQIVEFQLRFG